MHIKVNPEDFVVEEIIPLKKEQGNYLYIKLTKTSRNTLDVVEELSKRLRIPGKDIGFAGLKDKRAVTTQHLSLKNINEKQLANLKLKNVQIEILSTSSKPISLGDLVANKFKIKIDFEPKKLSSIINYFGPQRFSKSNWIIGKNILQSSFKGAVNMIDNQDLGHHLKQHPNDFIGALKKLDKRLLSLYINSYQSFVWNKVVSDYILLKYKPAFVYDGLNYPQSIKKNINIPLLSFGMQIKDKSLGEIYETILNHEGITKKDFLLKQIPELAPLPSSRSLLAKLENFKYEKPHVFFTLPKGSYATIALANMLALRNKDVISK